MVQLSGNLVILDRCSQDRLIQYRAIKDRFTCEKTIWNN